MLKEFFGACVEGRTKETVVYVSPKIEIQDKFEYFNQKYPMNFKGTAPIVRGINEVDVLATLTLPYTARSEERFASIHSDPPGIKTSIPAVAMKKFGKGTVIWSALSIESTDLYDCRNVFVNLLKYASRLDSTLVSDAAEDIEITAFKTESSLLVNAVLMNRRETARRVEDINVSIKTDFVPTSVKILPNGKEIPFNYDGKRVSFSIKGLKIFKKIEIK